MGASSSSPVLASTSVQEMPIAKEPNQKEFTSPDKQSDQIPKSGGCPYKHDQLENASPKSECPVTGLTEDDINPFNMIFDPQSMKGTAISKKWSPIVWPGERSKVWSH